GHHRHRARPSFPTRRSSDLANDHGYVALPLFGLVIIGCAPHVDWSRQPVHRFHELTVGIEPERSDGEIPFRRTRTHLDLAQGDRDRKSTRLNSSHLGISYAV